MPGSWLRLNGLILGEHPEIIDDVLLLLHLGAGF
jgi:hypothetical protein